MIFLIRTDLVTEKQEIQESHISGIQSKSESFGDVKIEKVKILSEDAAKVLGKPIGTYITISFGNLMVLADTEEIKSAVINAISELLPKKKENILVVGLGNADITPDAVGPLTADRLLATRHISGELARNLGLERLKSVSALIPGVVGKTGIEAIEIIEGTLIRTNPSAIIVIDALAARRTERLCRTIQLSDSGISPGSGVQNSRMEISEKVLGLPVIAIGIPTVVDVGSLIGEYTERQLPPSLKTMMVTPKDIDMLVRRSAEILADSLNIFLQPEIDAKIIRELV